MNFDFSPGHEEARKGFRSFFDEYILPFADEFDRRKEIPDAVIARLGAAGYLGATIPAEFQGQDFDSITAGLLFEEAGRSSCSLLSLLAVHGMVSNAIAKWASAMQKGKWLTEMAAGRALGAFALSESGSGSDAAGMETRAVPVDGGFLLNGCKKWISFGLRADLYLVFALCENKPVALLVERGTKGMSVLPVPEMMSFRAAQLGVVTFKDCAVPAGNLLGRIGNGLSHVMNFCLEYGRHCIAWGSVGVAQACFDSASEYASNRRQFGKPLSDHQLIQQMLADMITNIRAARLLCCRAGCLRDSADPSMLAESAMAKYFASRAAVKAAADALQIHGANGLSCEQPIQRHFRDAKALEIIEGSSQVLQLLIARHCC